MKGLNNMTKYEMLNKKNEIIRAAWEYMLRTGLANASVGGLCKEENLAQSSLYYWFENKDDIWINAGKYGLAKVIDELFLYTINHANDIRGYFDSLLQEIDKYKSELSCVIQITVSPVFGERMRETMKGFNFAYAEFAEQLVETFDCTFKQAETFIYSTLSAIVDYVVWNDGEKTQLLLDNLYERISYVLRGRKEN